jgi:hypothetical protein
LSQAAFLGLTRFVLSTSAIPLAENNISNLHPMSAKRDTGMQGIVEEKGKLVHDPKMVLEEFEFDVIVG